MDKLITSIRSILDKNYPKVQYEITGENQLLIPTVSKTGFEILVQSGKDDCILHFDNWHWHFENTENGNNELTYFLGNGLSKIGRLKVHAKKDKEHKWTFESKNAIDDTWYSMGTVGTINLKLWQKTKVKYYQNDLIELKKSV